MGELFEKLRKRREQVDEGGLHFESKPSEHTTDCRHSVSGPAGGDSAELVFESKPTAQKADCKAEDPDQGQSAARQPARRATSPFKTKDFRETIERQRAHVDEEGQTFQPSQAEAEKRAQEEADRKAKEDSARRALAAKADAERLAAARAAKAEDEERQAAEQVRRREAEEEASRQAEAERRQAAEAEERQRAAEAEERRLAAEAEAQRLATQEEAERRAAEEVERRAAEEAEAERRSAEEAERRAAEEVLAQSQQARIDEVEVLNSKVTWHVGLRSFPRIEEFESPAFHLGNSGPMHMRLRASGATGGACALSVHADGPLPAGIRAKLWVSKGWAKGKADKEWLEGDDLSTSFNVSLSGRSSVLCGIVYHLP